MLPREFVPGRFYLLTRRCTQRLFLLRPDDETNNNFLYMLAESAARFGIDVLGSCVEDNHHHTVLFDRHGRIVEFYEHLHKFVAKIQNAWRGRWENLWSSEPPSRVRLVDAGDVIDKLVYALTNPVKDGLVERVHHWPGVNTLSALLNRRVLTAHRPRHFFRANSAMHEVVTLELVLPPELGDPDEIRRIVRERVAAVEAAAIEDGRRTGRRILGRRAILKESWRDRPSSHEPRRELSPRVAARDKWARIETLLRDRAFRVAYRAARAAWLLGERAIFPAGTYWLRRFAAVPVAPTC